MSQQRFEVTLRNRTRNLRHRIPRTSWLCGSLLMWCYRSNEISLANCVVLFYLLVLYKKEICIFCVNFLLCPFYWKGWLVVFPGGTPRNSRWGYAARFSKSWSSFRPKNVIFHTRFQTCLWEIMSSLLRLNANKQDFLKSISNSHISLSLLFIWNWNDRYFHTFP